MALLVGASPRLLLIFALGRLASTSTCGGSECPTPTHSLLQDSAVRAKEFSRDDPAPTPTDASSKDSGESDPQPTSKPVSGPKSKSEAKGKVKGDAEAGEGAPASKAAPADKAASPEEVTTTVAPVKESGESDPQPTSKPVPSPKSKGKAKDKVKGDGEAVQAAPAGGDGSAAEVTTTVAPEKESGESDPQPTSKPVPSPKSKGKAKVEAKEDAEAAEKNGPAGEDSPVEEVPATVAAKEDPGDSTKNIKKELLHDHQYVSGESINSDWMNEYPLGPPEEDSANNTTNMSWFDLQEWLSFKDGLSKASYGCLWTGLFIILCCCACACLLRGSS